MKIVITADWHLGKNKNHDADILNGCLEIGAYVKKHEIKAMIIAGDIFDNPKPVPSAMKTFTDCLAEISTDRNILISGNHDIAPQHSALDTYASRFYSEQTHREIRIADHYTPIGYSDFNFVGYSYVENFSEYLLERIPRVENVLRPGVLVTHAEIPGTSPGAEREIKLGEIGVIPMLDKKAIKLIIAGHIHKHQSGKYNGIPFVYPGSLARASHSEEEEDKGFIVLETTNLTWEFVQRKSLRKWATVNVTWKSTVPIIKTKADVIRVNVTASSKYKDSGIRAMLEKQLKETYSQYQINIEYQNQINTTTQEIVTRKSFDDYERLWIKENSQGHTKEVTAQLRQIFQSVPPDAMTEKSEYTGLWIERVTIENFQNIGTIELTFKKNECIGILGSTGGDYSKSNGSGKTSFVEGIRWALYGATRYSRNENIIRDGCEYAMASIILRDDQNRQIWLSRDQTKKASTATVYYKKTLLAKGKAAASWVGVNTGLNLKMFDTIAYFGTARHTIVGVSATDRLKILQEPLPLEKYTKHALAFCAELRKEIGSELFQTEGAIKEMAVIQENALLRKDVQSITDLIDARTEIEQQLLHLRADLDKAMSRKKELENILFNFDMYTDLKPGLSKVETELHKVTKKLDETNIKQLRTDMQKLKKDTDLKHGIIQAQDSYLAVLAEQISNAEKYIEWLCDANGNSCPLCNQDWPGHNKDFLKSEKEKEIQQISTDIKKYEKDVSSKRQEYLSLFRELDRKAAFNVEYQQNLQKQKDMQKEKDKYLQKMAKYENQSKDFLVKHHTLQAEASSLELRIESLEEAIEEIAEENNILFQEISAYESAAARLSLLTEKKKVLEKKMVIVNICYQSCSAKGIARYILMSVIHDINNHIPGVLADFHFWENISIKLSVNPDKMEEVIILAKIGNKAEREYEGLSRGEKEITNFVVRFAYLRVLEMVLDVRSNFIFIDEALDSLDNENMKAAIQYFKNQPGQSFCISHNDLKDQFGRIITINN